MKLLRRKWREFFLPIDEESDFPESKRELQAMLATGNEVLAAEVLAEAEATHNRMAIRVDGAERRATTLQGAAAIAAGLTLTGAGLLVDAKLVGLGWKIAFGTVLVYLTLSLVLCAYRATLASAKVFRWTAPDARAILNRAESSLVDARSARAADLLKMVGDNARFARYKVAMMRAAAEWLTRALAALVVFALMAFLYAAFGTADSSTEAGGGHFYPRGSTPGASSSRSGG